MERRNSKEWIKSFKIALINNDIKKLEAFSKENLPEFSSIEEAKKALSLINQAKDILIQEKNKIGKTLQALKQAQNYNNAYSKNSSFEFKA